MAENLNVTYNQDDNISIDNLTGILTGYNGSMAVVGATIAEAGSKKISAVFKKSRVKV